MNYLEEAKKAVEQGKLAPWLNEYIHKIEPHNPELHQYIEKYASEFQGPEKVPISMIQRTLGPEPEMIRQEDPINFDTSVDNIKADLQTTVFKKFLLAEFDGIKFYLLDGNHTLEALKEIGHHECYLMYRNSGELAKKFGGSNIHN